MRTLIGWITIYFSLWTFKDIFVCFNSHEPQHIKDLIVYLDGWSTIAYGIYLIELSTPKWVTMKKIILMLIPFICFTLMHIFHHSGALLDLYIVFLVVVGVLIAAVSMINSANYLKYIRNTYSDLDNIDIS